MKKSIQKTELEKQEVVTDKKRSRKEIVKLGAVLLVVNIFIIGVGYLFVRGEKKEEEVITFSEEELLPETGQEDEVAADPSQHLPGYDKYGHYVDRTETPEQRGWIRIGHGTGGLHCYDLADYGVKKVRYVMVLSDSAVTGWIVGGADIDGVFVIHAQDPVKYPDGYFEYKDGKRKYRKGLGANAIFHFHPADDWGEGHGGVNGWCSCEYGWRGYSALGKPTGGKYQYWYDEDKCQATNPDSCSLGDDPDPCPATGSKRIPGCPKGGFDPSKLKAEGGYIILDVACGDDRSVCQEIGDSSSCEDVGYCKWYGVDGCDLRCKLEKTQGSCESDPICQWDLVHKSCKKMKCSSTLSEDKGRLIVDRPGPRPKDSGRDFCISETGAGENHYMYMLDYFDDPWMMTQDGDVFAKEGFSDSDGSTMKLYKVQNADLGLTTGQGFVSTYISSKQSGKFPDHNSKREYTLNGYTDNNTEFVGTSGKIYDYMKTIYNKNKDAYPSLDCKMHTSLPSSGCPNGQHVYFLSQDDTTLPANWLKQTPNAKRACVVISRGNITIPDNPGSTRKDNIDAYFMLDGKFTTESDGAVLVINGGVVANEVSLLRNTGGDKTSPSEGIKYDPKYVVLLEKCLGVGGGFKMREYMYTAKEVQN